MGAAFGDQDPGIGGEVHQFFGPLFVVVQIAFVVGKEDRERGEQTFCRFVIIDVVEDLRIGDDQFWGIFQLIQGFHQFVGGGT